MGDPSMHVGAEALEGADDKEKSGNLVPVLVKPLPSYKLCFFCVRAATENERSEGRCMTCDVPLEPKKMPFTSKRIAIMVAIGVVVLVVAMGSTIGIYAGATAEKRKVPVWKEKKEHGVNDKVDCYLYSMTGWGEWQDWSNDCGHRYHTRTRAVYAKGTGCPATTDNRTNIGPACCKSPWMAAPNSDNYPYCFRPYRGRDDQRGLEEAVNECQKEEASLAVPVNKSQALWFKEQLGKSYWLGIRVSFVSGSAKFDYEDPEKKGKTGEQETMGYVRWDFFNGPKPNQYYTFSEEGSELAIMDYERCMKEKKGICTEKETRDMWHTTDDRHKRLSFMCKRLHTPSPSQQTTTTPLDTTK